MTPWKGIMVRLLAYKEGSRVHRGTQDNRSLGPETGDLAGTVGMFGAHGGDTKLKKGVVSGGSERTGQHGSACGSGVEGKGGAHDPHHQSVVVPPGVHGCLIPCTNQRVYWPGSHRLPDAMSVSRRPFPKHGPDGQSHSSVGGATRTPSESGRLACKRFAERSSCSSLSRFPKKCGTVPSSLLKPRLRCLRVTMYPISGGRVPSSLL
mmetsp:Transcript_45820/g.111578  ORF Transcript_45820/g.111578 Transcript_45820/m.111578 type:complete len:207 (-) Transcript_45820:780-1400(-)